MNSAAEQPVRLGPEAEEQRADTTAIAGSVAVSGELWGTGSVLVEGTVTGGIRVDGTVTVARSGVVKGPIEAGAVCVAGSVTGDITARTYVRLEMTGSITGSVTMRSFIIEDGGYFNGQSHMTASGAEPVIVYQGSEEADEGDAAQ